MRPGKRQSDDGDCQSERGDQVGESQPPAREQEPDQVAKGAKRAGAQAGSTRKFLSVDRSVPEG